MKPPPSLARWLTLVTLLGGIVLRLVYLDADPDYYAWVGYITDEGRWVTHARELALFGRIINTDWLTHLLLAPLFELVSFAVFKLLGISMWVARLATAVSGCVLLIFFWAALRRVVTAAALLATLTLLALQVDLIALSRVSIPEMPAILVEFLVYFVLVSRPPSARRLFAAGLLLMVAAVTKATTLPSLAIFSAIVLLQPLQTGQYHRRFRSLLILWAGFLAPLLLTAPVWLRFAWRHLPDILSSVGMLVSFLYPSSLYSIASFFWESPLSSVFNVWALGICLSLLVWLGVPREIVDPTLRRWFVTSAIWYGMYIPLMLSLEYFPDRYKIHVLIPMAVNIASGISILQTSRLSTDVEALGSTRSGQRLVGLLLVGLPTATLWAPLLAGITMSLGLDPARFRARLTLTGIALLGTLWILFRRAEARRSLVFFIAFPIVAILFWLAAPKTGLADDNFWPVVGTIRPTWWMFGPWASALIAATIASVGRTWTPARWAAVISAAALCYAVLSVVPILPSYVSPHYSIRHASQDLGTTLADQTEIIATSAAEGLFNGNALPYHTILGKTWPPRKPELIVIAFKFRDPKGLLERDYGLVASYRIFVSNAYLNKGWTIVDADGHAEVVRVYKRKPGVTP